MTKEELKQEAEEWLCNNLHSASEEDFIKAMIDIAEPREKQIQIDAKQIRALQKQNGELTDKVKELEKNVEILTKVINNVHVVRIKQLEKENAELRKDKKELCHSISEGGKACVYLNEQLTKAKEIIREFVEWATWQGNSKCPSFKSIQDKAEQFLSEVEK
jgi:septal ring factor EnvC (AmiA/AmiB activator)